MNTVFLNGIKGSEFLTPLAKLEPLHDPFWGLLALLFVGIVVIAIGSHINTKLVKQ